MSNTHVHKHFRMKYKSPQCCLSFSLTHAASQPTKHPNLHSLAEIFRPYFATTAISGYGKSLITVVHPSNVTISIKISIVRQHRAVFFPGTFLSLKPHRFHLDFHYRTGNQLGTLPECCYLVLLSTVTIYTLVLKINTNPAAQGARDSLHQSSTTTSAL